jgi:ADP-ribose pyrophosphatase YjhB (NUDIX family)
LGGKNSHCSYCGAAFTANQPWPRTCATCSETSFVNPLPVAVVLVPIGAGLLAVRRSIPPGHGQLALPGGYMNVGESWQTAGAREVYEETGIRIDAAKIRDYATLSAPDGALLVFGLAAPLSGPLPELVENAEVSELAILPGPLIEPHALAFSLHTEVVNRYFAGRSSGS